MRIQPLSDFQKYELLVAILGIDPNGTVGHLVKDYMPEWAKFKKDVKQSLRWQRNLTCTDCLTLDEMIDGINTVTHRSYDYEDTDEQNDFTCNCSYCQWVLHQECDCPKCERNRWDTVVYKDYESGAEKKLYSRIN